MPLSEAAQHVRHCNRDMFLACLFIPALLRDGAMAIAALECELHGIRRAVQEEMIGHIRFAWWQESLEGLLSEGKTRGHPVLEALEAYRSQLPRAELEALVTAYRSAWPDMPQEADTLLDAAIEAYLTPTGGDALKRFQKARAIQRRHRGKYGSAWHGLLALKLMLGIGGKHA